MVFYGLFSAHKDIDVNLADKRGTTPLTVAASSGQESMVRLLLQCSDIDTDREVDDLGWTALSVAKMEGHEGIVKLLEERDAK